MDLVHITPHPGNATPGPYDNYYYSLHVCICRHLAFWSVYRTHATVLIPHTEIEALFSTIDNKTLSKINAVYIICLPSLIPSVCMHNCIIAHMQGLFGVVGFIHGLHLGVGFYFHQLITRYMLQGMHALCTHAAIDACL